MSRAPYTIPRSGRSTYMLIAALMAHDSGKAVYVIGADHEHASILESELGRILDRLGRSASETGISSIKFECTDGLSNFNWETGVLQGADKNCVVFVDHFAIERKFSWALREMHRFDREMP